MAGAAVSAGSAGGIRRRQRRSWPCAAACGSAVRRSRTPRRRRQSSRPVYRRDPIRQAPGRTDPPCTGVARSSGVRSDRACAFAIRPGGGRRHVVAPVPGTARGAWSSLFHLCLDPGVRRNRAVRGQSFRRQGPCDRGVEPCPGHRPTVGRRSQRRRTEAGIAPRSKRQFSWPWKRPRAEPTPWPGRSRSSVES